MSIAVRHKLRDDHDLMTAGTLFIVIAVVDVREEDGLAVKTGHFQVEISVSDMKGHRHDPVQHRQVLLGGDPHQTAHENPSAERFSVIIVVICLGQ